jgi:mono/diheme cytochrome c family protein
MIKKQRRECTFFAIVMAAFLLPVVSYSQQEQPEPWAVPDEYRTIENPVTKDSLSIATGKGKYNRYCAICHGRTGLGDGIKGKQMKTFPGDFSGVAYQSQTDGEHFYKTKFGRGEMPSYENSLSDEDIWHIVNYMRTFRKEGNQN